MQLHLNVGTIDRYLRIGIGAVLIGLAFAGVPGAPLLWASVAVGVILLATGLSGFCPLYAVLRLSTRSIHR